MAVVTAGHGADGAGLRISNTAAARCTWSSTSSASSRRLADRAALHPARRADAHPRHPQGDRPDRCVRIGQTRTVNGSSVASHDTFVIVANTTGVVPTRQTYLAVGRRSRTPAPDASLLNVNPGLVRSASTYAMRPGPAGLQLYNNAGSMHVVMDVAGTLDFYPSSTPGSAAGIGIGGRRSRQVGRRVAGWA